MAMPQMLTLTCATARPVIDSTLVLTASCTENAVAGDAGGVLDDGEALAGQFIEDGGLAHIGAAHDGYDRFCHICSPPSLLSYRLNFIVLRLWLVSMALQHPPPSVGILMARQPSVLPSS